MKALVAGPDPLSRAGLAAILAPWFDVVGQAAVSEVAMAATAGGAEVVIVDGGWQAHHGWEALLSAMGATGMSATDAVATGAAATHDSATGATATDPGATGAAATDDGAPGVAVVAGADSNRSAEVGEGGPIAGDVPVLALAMDEEDAAAAWRAGCRAILTRDAEGSTILTAARAVVAGLTVLDGRWLPERLAVGTGSTFQLPEPLTARELDVLALLAEGRSNRQIAVRLTITENTVKYHVNAVMAKLGAASRTEAVVRAARAGLVHL